MSESTDAERFVERFSEIWRSPEPDDFANLWDPEGTILHPGMTEPMPQSGIPEYMRRIKETTPDISLRVRNWAASGDVVLIEWTIRATFNERTLEWDGVDRFTLRGDRAIEGVAYFDSAKLRAELDPSFEQGDLIEAARSTSAA